MRAFNEGDTMATNQFCKHIKQHYLLGALVSALVSGCGGGGGSGLDQQPSAGNAVSPQPTDVREPAAALTQPEAQTGQQTLVNAVNPAVVTGVSNGGGQQLAQANQVQPNPWGTFQKLFAADSPWNSRPVNPVFGTETIPTSTYFPAVAEGSYSVGVFEASSTDQPMVVLGPVGGSGVWNPDAERHQESVTVPRWPANTLPASGTDGHADIVDPISGIVHSFFKLKNVDGQWRALQYAWSPLKGRGWGNPSHYFQGARAAGVPTSGGVIRTHEINDGDSMYRHALAMSLTYNGLSAAPTYVFPATSSDSNAATTNTGSIPMGSLMMLPPGFDTSKITNTDLRKVAETLKTYGAYVVDRNVGTPFVIYVELGSGFSLHKGGWNNAVAADLQTIRAELRRVVGAGSWIDGDGKLADRSTNKFNLISMRGPWSVTSGGSAGVFDTWQQALVFPATTVATTQVNTGSNIFGRLSWGKPTAGMQLKFVAHTTGGAKVRLQLTDCSNPTNNVDTGMLKDGESSTFTWPANKCGSRLTAVSGTDGPSTIKAELLSLL